MNTTQSQPTSKIADFHPTGLSGWLDRNVPNFKGPFEVRQFGGGQSNPTFKIEASSGYYVLRRKPLGELLPKAHAVDREYRVLAALAETSVPVAKVYALCQDDDVIGSPFYVMGFVPGRVFWDPRLPELKKTERVEIFNSLNATIAKLHSIDPQSVGLEDFGRPNNYMARQVDRWSKQYRLSETRTIQSMDHLIEWLPKRAPPDGEARIVHGDYRLDNVLIHPTEPRIAAVLDWELSTIGDPIADFAYHAMAWRIAPDLFRGLANIDFAALGIPREDEYFAKYCSRTGREEIPNWEYYIIYSMFRISALLQGIAKRASDGTAADPNAHMVGEIARPIADQAWLLAKELG